MKNIMLTDINCNEIKFKLWELKMLFGSITINLNNANPVIDNDFFKMTKK
jgi:hypothetical protein